MKKKNTNAQKGTKAKLKPKLGRVPQSPRDTMDVAVRHDTQSVQSKVGRS